MLFHLTAIFVCQLIGEALVTGLGLPVPGPVIGMALLFAALMVMKRVPDNMAVAADGLLKHLSLLFIPAGVGVILHAELLQRELLPISVALVISTLLAIAVTGILMNWFLRGKEGDERS